MDTKFMVTTVALGMVFSGGAESRSLLESTADTAPIQTLPQQAPMAPAAIPAAPSAAAMPADTAAPATMPSQAPLSVPADAAEPAPAE